MPGGGIGGAPGSPGRPITAKGGCPIGLAVFLMKRDRTTGSGGFEYAAGSITSVLA
jgi:hypothetical protein